MKILGTFKVDKGGGGKTIEKGKFLYSEGGHAKTAK